MYRALAKAIYLAGALLLLVAFFDAIFVIIPFFLMAVIFAIGLSPAVNWLEERRFPRALAAIVVLLSLGAVAAGIVALVVPQVAKESQHFYENVNQYGQQ